MIDITLLTSPERPDHWDAHDPSWDYVEPETTLDRLNERFWRIT